MASSLRLARSSQAQDSADGQRNQLEAAGIWRKRNDMQPGVAEAMIEGISREETRLAEQGDCGKAFPCK